MPTVYSKEGIIAQALIAFGQGAGSLRISHDAALAVRRHYEELFDAQEKPLVDRWEMEAVQALERVRASGRKAAQDATDKSQTAIQEEDATSAMSSVESTSTVSNIC